MSDDLKPAHRPEPSVGVRVLFALLQLIDDLWNLIPSLILSAEERRRGGMRAAKVEAACHERWIGQLATACGEQVPKKGKPLWRPTPSGEFAAIRVWVDGWVDPVFGAEVRITLLVAPKRSLSPLDVPRHRYFSVERIADGRFAELIRQANATLGERVQRNARHAEDFYLQAVQDFVENPPTDRMHVLAPDDIDRLWTPIISELLPCALEEMMSPSPHPAR